MLNLGLRDEYLQKLRAVLQSYPQVERAVVFGSRARGNYRENSDIDIAVYRRDNGEDWPAGLRTALDDAAGIYKIDIVDMNTLKNEALRQQIETGCEIYSRS